MKKAVIYARYSSDRQTEQSIEGQLRVCNDYAERNNISIIDTYIDRAMTGTNDKRLAFQKMIRDSEQKSWDYVIVYKLDRFSRNKYEMAIHRKTLRDNGIKILSASESIPDSPEGIILEPLLEGMAEYYSAELSQKTKRGMNESRQKGLFTGGSVLYGYNVVNKKIYIDKDQAEVIKYIYDKHISGTYIKEIVQDLTEKGILYKGKPFKEATVRKFLKNEKYVGIYRYRDEIFTNIYPSIITKETYDAAREKFKANQFGKPKKGVSFILKERAICGYCGGKIRGGAGKTEKNKIRRYYSCSNRMQSKSCQKKHMKKELIEQLILDTTFKIFENKENLDLLINKILESHNSNVKNYSFIKLAEQEKSVIQISINNLMNNIENGIITETIKTRLCELETKLNELNEKLSNENSKLNEPITKEELTEFITTSLKQNASFLINLLTKKIIIYDDKIEIYYKYANKTDTLESVQECPFFIDKIEKKIKNTKINGKNYIMIFEINAYV